MAVTATPPGASAPVMKFLLTLEPSRFARPIEVPPGLLLAQKMCVALTAGPTGTCWGPMKL